MVEISTSILSVKKEEAIQTFYDIETAKTDYFHIDVMDGKFVNKNTNELMLEYCDYLSNITNLPLDVHLMVEDVPNFIEEYAIYKPNIITFHYEATKNEDELKKWIQQIKEKNIRVGISIKPNTKVEEILKILPYIHVVLIMTVEPGEGGQELIPETIEKIRKLKEYIYQNDLEVDIEADGGINKENVAEIKQAGCDIIVAGTSIINSKNYSETIATLSL